MKALVTGASGHLGTNLVRRLVADGREVRAFVRPTSPRESLTGLPVEFVEGDILDPASLKDAMTGCDVVYHAAAVYRMWALDPDDILRPTVEGSRNVLEAAHASGVSKIVYISTTGTIGFTRDPKRPLDETAFNTHSRNPYLRAKRLAEAHARQFHERTGLPIVFVLPGLIMGAHFTRITPSVQYVLDYLRRGAFFYFRTGFCIVDAEDVARGALLAEERGRIAERYILGGENVPFRRMYHVLSEITGNAPPRLSVPRVALTPLALLMEAFGRMRRQTPLLTRDLAHDFGGRYLFFSSEKAKRELGYAHLDADDVLRRTVEWLYHRGFAVETKRRR